MHTHDLVVLRQLTSTSEGYLARIRSSRSDPKALAALIEEARGDGYSASLAALLGRDPMCTTWGMALEAAGQAFASGSAIRGEAD